MLTNRVEQARPSPRSCFVGAFQGHALAAQKAVRSIDKVHALTEGTLWSHEVTIAQTVACNLIRHKGRLEMRRLGDDLEALLALERRQGLTFQGGLRGIALNMVDLNSGWIGGPGFAAHVFALGLKNHNNLNAIAEETFDVGTVTHNSACAIAGGMIVAAAIALAVNEGKNPEAVWHQLNIFMDGLPKAFRVPDRLRRRLDSKKTDSVESLMRRNIPTEKGIKKLEFSSEWLNKTALGVIPGAIFASLNAPLSFKFLLKALRAAEIDNYKFWAIAGAIRGAMVGEEGIPKKMIASLSNHEDITNNAEQLYSVTASLPQK